MMLKSLAWLPAMASESGCDQYARRLEVGSKLFVKSRDALQLLAGHVSYLWPDPLPTSSLASFLGIQRSISVEFTAELLKSWCDRRGNESVPATFRTSLQHMRTVYNFLDEHMTKHQLADLLHHHPVIFHVVPSHAVAASVVEGKFLYRSEVMWADETGLFEKYRESAASVVEGKFLYRSEVMWADETGLFEKYRESLLNADPASAKLYRYPLSIVYSDMMEFFTQTVHVMRSPGVADFTQLLIHISTTCVVPRALPDVLSIFSLIGRRLFADGSAVDDAVRGGLERLKSEKVIPGKNGCWLGLECCPMIADDRQLEKMFPEDAAVFFVDCGEKLGVRKTAGLKGLQLCKVLNCSWY